jgi:predicted nucleic acid-binding protein
MIETVTIDASVLISAFTPGEPFHEASKAFMKSVRALGTPIICPVLVIPEVAAAIGRGQGQPERGLAFAEEVVHLPNLTLISLDQSLAMLAAETAATRKLRASDAVYAAVSLRFATALVTLDREQLARFEKAVSP